jgi:anti-sigma B factor antagonist
MKNLCANPPVFNYLDAPRTWETGDSMGDNSAVTAVVLDGGSTAHILLSGDLDLTTGATLGPAVQHVLVDPRVRRVEIDVALVPFCDSSGLSALLVAQKLATRRGVPLYLVQVGPRLEMILDVTGLGGLLCAPS